MKFRNIADSLVSFPTTKVVIKVAIPLIAMIFYTRLQVVSTRVGGVPEVLPDDMIKLAEPSVKCKLNVSIK